MILISAGLDASGFPASKDKSDCIIWFSFFTEITSTPSGEEKTGRLTVSRKNNMNKFFDNVDRLEIADEII